MTTLDLLRVGRPVPFGPRGDRSSIGARVTTAGPVMAGPTGLAGDEVGDPGLHGGADKAIHHYPAEHYAAWAAELPALGPLRTMTVAWHRLKTDVGRVGALFLIRFRRYPRQWSIREHRIDRTTSAKVGVAVREAGVFCSWSRFYPI